MILLLTKSFLKLYLAKGFYLIRVIFNVFTTKKEEQPPVLGGVIVFSTLLHVTPPTPTPWLVRPSPTIVNAPSSLPVAPRTL